MICPVCKLHLTPNTRYIDKGYSYHCENKYHYEFAISFNGLIFKETIYFDQYRTCYSENNETYMGKIFVEKDSFTYVYDKKWNYIGNIAGRLQFVDKQTWVQTLDNFKLLS